MNNYFIAVYSFEVPKITGTVPLPISCPDYLCKGRKNGNYQYNDPYSHVVNKHYFVQCSNGHAHCQPCFPTRLIFREECNQCLNTEKGEFYSYDDDDELKY